MRGFMPSGCRVMAPLVSFLMFFLIACGQTIDIEGEGKALPEDSFIKTDDDTAASSWGNPFSHIPGIRYQTLLLADDIDGSGYIWRISFERAADQTILTSCPNLTIKMGHTSLNDLTSTYADNVELGQGSFITVMDVKAVSVPEGAAGEYFWLDLDEPFYYNGADNLVIELLRTLPCDNDELDILGGADVPYNGVLWHYLLDRPVGFLHASHLNAKLQFKGGVDTVDHNDSSEEFNAPLDTVFSKSLFMYKADVINGSGPVTGIGFRTAAATTGQSYAYTMRIGHTKLDGVAVQFNDNFDAGRPVTIAKSATLHVPPGIAAGEYFWVPVPEGTFRYNGKDNLVIEIAVTNATGSTPLSAAHVSGASLVAGVGDQAGSVSDISPHIALRFKGGTVDVNTPTGMSGGWGEDFPFLLADERRQWLYLASELGTKGAINKLYCRAWSDSVAAAFDGYKIQMAHTTANTLSSSFSDNLSSPVTVFNGAYAIAESMKKGDWFEIPLSKAFDYNGTDNLIIDLTDPIHTGTGLANNACVVDVANPARYNGRNVSSSSADSPTGSVRDYLVDIRLGLQ